MAIIITSHFKDEIEALLSEEPEKWVLHLWLITGCVCVGERVWVKDQHGPRREAVCVPSPRRPAGGEWLGFDWLSSLVSDRGMWTS